MRIQDMEFKSVTDATLIENRMLDEIAVGDVASLSRSLREEDFRFASLIAGESDPMLPVDAEAAPEPYQAVPWPDLWGSGLITTVIATQLPGPGSAHLSQSFQFLKSARVGDTITASVAVIEKRLQDQVVVLDCRCIDQSGQELVSGRAEIKAPQEKIRRPRAEPLEVHVVQRRGYVRLMDAAAGGDPVPTAVAHPCSAAAITAAVEAAEAGLIVPILVGPEPKIRRAAEESGKDISAFRLVPADHSHAAADKAVELVRQGEATLLMKGSLHTDELMGAIVSSTGGLRTERRISHAYVMDVPDHPGPLIITDAAVNIAPTLEDKADIARNAIDLAHVLGIEKPKVAILSAVETVNPAMASTLDAAALCKMADRGQISGGVLDGPLAFDNAISPAAAREKGIVSPVAGQADILLAPDIEAGNMLAKQLTFLGDADAAGIVLGARVPVILTSRADSLRTRLASCAVAVLLARAAARATDSA
jgi:phosphotransacetylase/acyl dehydratase